MTIDTTDPMRFILIALGATWFLGFVLAAVVGVVRDTWRAKW